MDLAVAVKISVPGPFEHGDQTSDKNREYREASSYPVDIVLF
jgi:hypothetical protein